MFPAWTARSLVFSCSVLPVLPVLPVRPVPKSATFSMRSLQLFMYASSRSRLHSFALTAKFARLPVASTRGFPGNVQPAMLAEKTSLLPMSFVKSSPLPSTITPPMEPSRASGFLLRHPMTFTASRLIPLSSRSAAKIILLFLSFPASAAAVNSSLP